MMEKKTTIEEATRAQIAAFLEGTISKTLDSYRDFVKGGELEKSSSKEFGDAHKAAKVAISHIELLIKLAKWADLTDAERDGYSQLSYLLGDASGEVKSFHAKWRD